MALDTPGTRVKLKLLLMAPISTPADKKAEKTSRCVQLAPTLNGYITVTKTVTLPKKLLVDGSEIIKKVRKKK